MTQRTITPASRSATLLAVIIIFGTTLLATEGFSQNKAQPAPVAPVPEETAEKASAIGVKQGDDQDDLMLYSIKFNGGRAAHLAEVWKKAMPNDTIVMTESAEWPNLPAFEIRNARLTELARSIAFLSEGALTIEVLARDSFTPGNIWRIGTPPTKAAGSVKMRAVAVPRLCVDEKSIKNVLNSVEELEVRRLKIMEQRGKVDFGTMMTSIHPLPPQNVFVLMGTEEGIAGVESFLKAAEQNAETIAAREESAKAVALREQQIREAAKREQSGK